MKMKASMVAMSGAIMPDPLAMPLMATGVSPIRVFAPAPLAKVSVVRIASAADSQPPSPSAAASFGIVPGDASDIGPFADDPRRCDRNRLLAATEFRRGRLSRSP